jgi:LPS sulfotransferase NodH
MNIWILSEKRTGSSYLCELINYTEKFEDQFKEWYVQFDNRKEITNFYKKPNLPKYCKIHSSVMKTIFGSIQELKNKIGFCKFIHLKRRNLRKMLVSQLLAQKTEKARNAIIKQNHPMTHELLKKTIQLL